MKNIIKITVFVSLFALVFAGCVKENFDMVPEKVYTVDFEANTTIAELKAMSFLEDKIIGDIIIKGTVISTDEFGNFHKELIIQDSTAGVRVNLNKYNLYKGFPIGRMVYIKCKGLNIREYKGMKELNLFSNGGVVDIPESAIEDILFRSEEGMKIVPKAIKIGELTDAHLNTLVKFKGVEFVESDTAKMFINPDVEPEVSYGSDRTIIDFAENSIVIRTSPYSAHQDKIVPKENGDIVAVYSKYRDNYQLVIRDFEEINMTGDRIVRTYLFEENFNGNIGTFLTYDVLGNKDWYPSSHGGETFMKVSGYGGSANEDWLISPALDFSNNENVSLTFRHAVGYLKSWDDMTVWVSSDYDGTSSPTENGTWEEITGFNQPIPSGSFSSFESSGGLDISEYGGNSSVYVAFKYVCASSATASTWEVATVKIIVQ